MKRWSAALLCVLALGCDRKDAEPWVETETDAGVFAVVAVDPADGTTGVSCTPEITVEFNRRLPSTSLQLLRVLKLTKPLPAALPDAGGADTDAGEPDAQVPADSDAGIAEEEIAWSGSQQNVENGCVATISPETDLEPETTYVLKIAQGALESEAQEPLAVPFRSSFTTGNCAR